MNLTKYIDSLQSKGRYTFTFEEYQKESKKSEIATRAELRRMKAKGYIASPTKKFFIIIPPEYRSLGSLPAVEFIHELMTYLKAPYYVGLLSAAEFYGVAHQKPQEFQVITEKNRHPIKCGRVYIRFVANKRISKASIEQIKTSRGFVWISTSETTAIDLVSYHKQAGGLSNVATVLKELEVKINDKLFMKELKKTNYISTIQKMGYILNRIIKSKLANTLQGYVKNKAKAYIPLLAAASVKGAKKDDRWKILVNTEIEVD